MTEFEVKLIEVIKITDTVKSFRFLPKEKINFYPGQFMQVIFDESDIKNNKLNKYLSFSSSPTKEYIEFTKRLSNSEFSYKLNSLKTEDKIKIKGPFGDCIFKEEYKKICFLIGGIGITPVMSIVEYIVDKNLDTDIILIYANRDSCDIPFKERLNYWEKINKIKIFYLVEFITAKDRNYICGLINKDLIIKNVKDLSERVFFIFGPPKMVNYLKEEITGLNIKEIKTESFLGY